MTGLARSVLDRDWFRPLRELFYPCAAMIAMASITGLLSTAPASGRHWALEVVRFAVAGALAAALALAVLAMWQRAFGAGSRSATRRPDDRSGGDPARAAPRH
ncbi:MAG: hypothetical protein F2793_09770 [Actinobacteria bacterium]|nr:hypothetical protein [Actinomycetota bacterium]